jgi:nucleoid DNA-binding protein
MDISKYIIKFLIKNRYCSLPGLGSFEVEKKSAAISKQDGEITPAKFEIKFSPLGSIDDTFASFIANHENVSISNTSNNIKEFCRSVKEEIAQNGKFTIENLGYLLMQNNKIAFVQTDELDMGLSALPLPPIDTNLKNNANKKLDFSYPSSYTSYRRKKLSVGKFVLPALLIILIATGCYFAYTYIAENQKSEQPAAESNTTLPLQKDSAAVNVKADSVQTNKDSAIAPSAAPANPQPAANGTNPLYKVAIFQTASEATAKAKATKWQNYGNLTEVQNVNGNFIVSILASHPANDTTLLVDSLRRFFNPKGQVFILK